MQTIYAGIPTGRDVPEALRDVLAELRAVPGWPRVALNAAAVVADVLAALGYEDQTIADLLGTMPAEESACA